MLKAIALQHFRTRTAIAIALDISQAAVSQWGDVIPVESAKALELLTHNALKVDWSLYPATRRALRETRAGRRPAA